MDAELEALQQEKEKEAAFAEAAVLDAAFEADDDSPGKVIAPPTQQRQHDLITDNTQHTTNVTPCEQPSVKKEEEISPSIQVQFRSPPPYLHRQMQARTPSKIYHDLSSPTIEAGQRGSRMK